jgi:hypothetical protein
MMVNGNTGKLGTFDSMKQCSIRITILLMLLLAGHFVSFSPEYSTSLADRCVSCEIQNHGSVTPEGAEEDVIIPGTRNEGIVNPLIRGRFQSVVSGFSSQPAGSIWQPPKNI